MAYNCEMCGKLIVGEPKWVTGFEKGYPCCSENCRDALKSKRSAYKEKEKNARRKLGAWGILLWPLQIIWRIIKWALKLFWDKLG